MISFSPVIGRLLRPRFLSVSVICALLLSLAGMQKALGQRTGPFRGAFYPPKLIMRYQDKINLTPTQRDSIRTAYARAQSRYHRLDLDLQREMQALRRLVEQPRANVDSAEAQLNRVLSIENRLKRVRLRMVVNVKNTLTPEQQAALDTLRTNWRRRPRR